MRVASLQEPVPSADWRRPGFGWPPAWVGGGDADAAGGFLEEDREDEAVVELGLGGDGFDGCVDVVGFVGGVWGSGAGGEAAGGAEVGEVEGPEGGEGEPGG